MSETLRPADYTIAWIAVLPIAVEAAIAALDKRHDGHFELIQGDNNTYIGGEINGHYVVIVKLPAGQVYNMNSAATLINQVKARFENLWFGLLVGVATGLPDLSTGNAEHYHNMHLGDILVYIPDKSSKGIIHYDFERDADEEPVIETKGRTLELPPHVGAAIRDIQFMEKPFRKGNEFSFLLEQLSESMDNDRFDYPEQDHDELLEHKINSEALLPNTKLQFQPRDDLERTNIWYGMIGSGSTTLIRNAIRDARFWNELQDRSGLIGFEIEGAGAMEILPTVVLRGVCDYGDDLGAIKWQSYATAVATVYAKAILSRIRPTSSPLKLEDDDGSKEIKVQTSKHSVDLTQDLSNNDNLSTEPPTRPNEATPHATEIGFANEPLQQAITEFRDQLQAHELIDFRHTTREDVQTLLLTMQNVYTHPKDMFDIRRLEKYLEAADQLSQVVEILVNIDDAVAFIWGPVGFLLRGAHLESKAFKKLLDTLQSLGEQFPLILQYETLFGMDYGMQHILALLYCELLDFHRKIVPIFRKPVWKQFRPIWKSFGPFFDKTLSSSQRYARMLDAQAHLIHSPDDHITRASLIHLENEQRMASRKFEADEEARKIANMSVVREWLGVTGLEDEHHFTFESRCQGTGGWILEEKQFSQWMYDDVPQHSLLWLHGIPGAGKSVLASIIIESCKNIKNADVVHFYCSSGQGKRNTLLSILRGFLAQVFALCGDLIPYFLETCYESNSVILADEGVVRNLTEVACSSGKRLYFILDGLDECSRDDRMQILELFTSLAMEGDSNEPGKLRILVTSQTEDDILRALRYANVFELLPEHSKGDISKFVSKKTELVQQRFEISDDEKSYIDRRVSYKAAGQFLYAKLIVENLLSQHFHHDLLDELRLPQFPTELTRIYQRIWDRNRKYSTEHEWSYIQKILGWMVCAIRPMTWIEIQTLSSIDTDRCRVDFHGRPLKFDLKKVCGTLITVANHTTVTWVHHTAITFVVNSGLIIPELATLHLSTLCLQYLALPCFSADLPDAEFISHIRSGQFDFQDYAIAQWEQHFRQALSCLSSLWQRRNQPECEEALNLFAEAIAKFANTYDEDFLVPESKGNEDDELSEVTDILRNLGIFECVIKISDHTQAHRAAFATAFDHISLKRLEEAHKKSRAHIEKSYVITVIDTASARDSIQHYERERFKCPKLTCYYFHHGFPDTDYRQHHLEQHERPFQCPIQNCSALEFGFSSNKTLGLHMHAYHPRFEDATDILLKHGYSCHRCEKQFVREADLEKHMHRHKGYNASVDAVADEASDEESLREANYTDAEGVFDEIKVDQFFDVSNVSSIKSMPFVVTNSTVRSKADGYGFEAVQQLVTMFSEDSILSSIYETLTNKLNPERFHKNHDQVLKTFFKDLRLESQTYSEVVLVRVLRHHDQRNEITTRVQQIFRKSDLDKRRAMELLKTQDPDPVQLLDRLMMLTTDLSRRQYINRVTEEANLQIRDDIVNKQDDVSFSSRSSDSGDDVDEDNDVDEKMAKDVSHTIEDFELFIKKSTAFTCFKTSLWYLSNLPTNLADALGSRNLHVIQRFLTRNFNSITSSGNYEWLNELHTAGYSKRELSELLLEDADDSPWIYFLPPEAVSNIFLPDHHTSGCAHRKAVNDGISSSTCDHVLPNASNYWAGVRRKVEELCGLAGITPTSRDISLWHGTVSFEDNNTVSRITYNQSTSGKDGRWTKLSSILANFFFAAATVQSAGLCCNSFTILHCLQNHLELRRIEFQLVQKMDDLLKVVVRDGDNVESVKQCVEQARQILQHLKGNGPGITMDDQFHICALAVQFVCVAFLSYVQAHVGAMKPFFLDTPQQKLILLGNQHITVQSGIEVRLFNMTCLEGVTKDHVMAFSTILPTLSTQELENNPPRYHVLANAEDLLDTWGPGYLFHDNVDHTIISAIAIGGGIIYSLKTAPSIFHWTKDVTFKGPYSTFNSTTKLLIGAIINVNATCNIDKDLSRSNAFCALENLNTHGPFWEVKQRQGGLQGGQYLSTTFVQGWNKVPGRTLKECSLEQSKENIIRLLDQNWGLQVSFCTSVARRVPLRQLVADLSPGFVNPLDQDLWQELTNVYDIINVFMNSDIYKWLGQLPDSLKVYVLKMVYQILEQLRHTGLDHQNNTLKVAWPLKGDFRGLKIPCATQTCWASILADAEDCATFAYITTQCLETRLVKCQGGFRVWQNVSKMLITEMSQYRPEGNLAATVNAAHVLSSASVAAAVAGIPNNPTTVTTTRRNNTTAQTCIQWRLGNQEIYYIKKFDLLLWGKVERSSTTDNDVPHLVIEKSKIPQRIWARLTVREENRRNHYIREKQMVGDHAEWVVVRSPLSSS